MKRRDETCDICQGQGLRRKRKSLETWAELKRKNEGGAELANTGGLSGKGLFPRKRGTV